MDANLVPKLARHYSGVRLDVLPTEVVNAADRGLPSE
jgi:hypothetical protein